MFQFDHPGDSEPFVVFLTKAADGTWNTPASFVGIAAVAHAGTQLEKQSYSTVLRANVDPELVKPELWVGYKKHGNFVELSKCTPDWLNLCVTTPALFSYKLHNVGEHLARSSTTWAPSP